MDNVERGQYPRDRHDIPTSLLWRHCLFEKRAIYSVDGRVSSIYTSTTGDNILSDTIAVYDVHANTFRVSSQRLPITREPPIDSNCCIIRNCPLESFVMFGYVRRLYASEPFENVMDIPLHLLFLMTRWVAFDFVRVRDTSKCVLTPLSSPLNDLRF